MTMSTVKPLETLDGMAALNDEAAALFLGVSKSTLVRLRESGQIKSITINNCRRIRVSDLSAYLRRL